MVTPSTGPPAAPSLRSRSLGPDPNRCLRSEGTRPARFKSVATRGAEHLDPSHLLRLDRHAALTRRSSPVSDDGEPFAYERLVDQLLASPRYGERWARHWLDVVHYGDTHGYDKDKPRPWAWPYRDYVVRSLNDDKPYQRFVREQIAGDHLWPDDPDAIVATGFIAAGPWDFIGHAEVPETKIDGQIARTSIATTWLLRPSIRLSARPFSALDATTTSSIRFCRNITMDCKRCSPHWIGPIASSMYPLRLHDVGELQRNLDHLDQRRSADGAAADEESETDPQAEAIRAKLESLPAQRIVYAGTVHHGSGAFRGTGPDGGRPRPVFVLYRGDVTSPGPPAKPGTLAFGDPQDGEFQLDPGHSEGERRAALAQWLVRPDHPLTCARS